MQVKERVSVRLTWGEEPIAVNIIKTGWRDKYFVVKEFGDIEDWNLMRLTKEEIITKYGEEVLEGFKDD